MPEPVLEQAAPGSSRKRAYAQENEPPPQQEQQQQLAQKQADPQPQQPENAFEAARRQRIERNRQVLQQLGVQQAARAVADGGAGAKPKRARQPKRTKDGEGGGDAAPAPQPSRRSSRLAERPAEPADAAGSAHIEADEEADAGPLLTQAEYFAHIGQPLDGFAVDGKFKGWVAADVCELYGIAPSAAEAWEAGGGGAFSRKPDMAAVPARLRANGWSDAKAFAATQLKKNPNAFFYRHVAPHETQAQGKWSAEEQERFLQVARQHGVGDKWGLFASHIGTRVGFQCSAFYRDVIVAQGLVLDDRFRLTRGGRAVFVGAGGARAAAES